MQKVRYAPPDPTLPKPWRGLVDTTTSNLYFWNPETNITTYVRPTADSQPPHPDLDNHSDPHPDLDNHSDQSQIHGLVNHDSYSEDINNDDPSRQAKRKDTREFRTPKKQKTISPPSIVDAVEYHVDESIMKPIEVSQSVDKEQQESDEVHTPDHLVKEKQKMSEVEGEDPQSASTNGAELEAKLLQANRLENFEMNVISSICTTLVTKVTGNSLSEEMSIMGADANQELLSVADGSKGLGEEMINRDGLTEQDAEPIIDNMSNDNVDCPMIDSTQIETNLEKQPINQSLAPPFDHVEEDLALTEFISRLAGVTYQLSETVEAMRGMIQYVVSVKEANVQRRCENEELKNNVADLNKKVTDLEAKLKETMAGKHHSRGQFLGS